MRDAAVAGVASAWARAGNPERGRALIVGLSDDPAGPFSRQRALTLALVATGSQDAAEEFVASLDKDARGRAQEHLVRGLIAAGARDRALRSALAVPTSQARAEALILVLPALAEDEGTDGGKDAERIESIAELATSAVMTIKDDLAAARALGDLTEALAAARLYQRVIAVAGQTRTVARKIANPFRRAEVLTRLLCALRGLESRQLTEAVTTEAQAAAREVDQAVEVDPSASADRQSQALAGLAEVLVQNAQLDRALEIVRSIRHPRFQAGALIRLITAYVEADDRKQALALAGEVEELAAQFVSASGHAWVIGSVVDVLIQLEEQDRAAAVVRSSLVATLESADSRDRQEVLVTVVRMLIAAGQRERAIELAETVEAMGRPASPPPTSP
jgi:tetratricopeptide (TPR) repeat protein